MDKYIENDILKAIGSNIKRIREKLEISQEELSFRSGLNRNYVSDTERGKRNISVKSLEKIAKGLNVNIEELLKQ